VLSWINDLSTEHGLLDRKELQIDVAGMCADRAKIFFWRHESLPLPLAYLDDNELVGRLKDALKLAEEVGQALRSAAWATVANRLTGDSGMNPDKGRVSALLDSFAPERMYWSRLELPYRILLIDLADAEKPESRSTVIQNWFFKTLHKTALLAFEHSIGRMVAGRDLKATTIGAAMLRGLLLKIQKADNIPDLERKEGVA